MEQLLEGMPIRIACTYRERLVGLLFTSTSDRCLLLAHCSGVHTFGMRFGLDIAFLDGSGLVLESHREVPSCRILSNKRAKSVLERISTPQLPWLEEGQQVEISVISSNEAREGKPL